MCFEIESWQLLRGQSLIFVKCQDFDEELLCHFWKLLSFKNLSDGFWLNLLNKLFFSFSSPWGISSQHFKENYSYRPKIGFVGIFVFLQWFRCHVKRRSNVIFAWFSEFFALNSESKICNFQNFGIGDQKVGRFQIAMNDLMVINFSVAFHELCHIETSLSFSQFVLDNLIHIRRT